jgi:outer membrane protein assembly factor BamB
VSNRIGRLLPRSKRVRAGLTGLLVALAAVAVAGYAYERHRTGSIYHPNARFVSEPAPRLPRGPARFAWPLYGYRPEHTRFFPAPPQVRPPFDVRWIRSEGALLEFPPVLDEGRIFQLADDGVLYAINKHTGHTIWRRHLGRLSASTPAVVGNTVWVTVLERHDGGGGSVFGLNAATGRILWSRDLSSPSESSPLVDRGMLFFGSQSGIVYALNASNGSVIWTYHAAGAVKASPSLKDGVLYFGDYSGNVQAISERTGRRLWLTSSEGALLGSGTFYSTPAVVYGRVFLGNTDGRIYAYDAATGKLDWAVQTGDYVYASPAVANAPGLGPTIYLGSYDGTFYALNARTGHIAWKDETGGRISGSATIVGRTVYFADLGEHRTYGLGISTGHVEFEMHTGGFDPVISDGQNIYLTGYTALYALAPRSTTASAARTSAAHASATRAPGAQPARAGRARPR